MPTKICCAYLLHVERTDRNARYGKVADEDYLVLQSLLSPKTSSCPGANISLGRDCTTCPSAAARSPCTNTPSLALWIGVSPGPRSEREFAMGDGTSDRRPQERRFRSACTLFRAWPGGRKDSRVTPLLHRNLVLRMEANHQRRLLRAIETLLARSSASESKRMAPSWRQSAHWNVNCREHGSRTALVTTSPIRPKRRLILPIYGNKCGEKFHQQFISRPMQNGYSSGTLAPGDVLLRAMSKPECGLPRPDYRHRGSYLGARPDEDVTPGRKASPTPSAPRSLHGVSQKRRLSRSARAFAQMSVSLYGRNRPLPRGQPQNGPLRNHHRVIPWRWRCSKSMPRPTAHQSDPQQHIDR